MLKKPLVHVRAAICQAELAVRRRPFPKLCGSVEINSGSWLLLSNAEISTHDLPLSISSSNR
jgi:hypothetical protein